VRGEEREEPPLAGRQEPFWGAVGTGKFKVATTVQPTQVQVGVPLTLSVRITALGPWQRPPQRYDLRQEPEWARDFLMDNGPDRFFPDRQTWEFDYILRPRSEAVQRVPPLRFVYFRPGLVPAARGYMTTQAPAIPLTVQPRPEVKPADVQGPTGSTAYPERFYHLVEGPAVLESQDPVPLFHPRVWVLLFLTPPLVGAGWYLVWRARYPDAARLARQRRSRAAREALMALYAARNRGRILPATTAEAILTTYLRRRLDLTAVEPTAAEVAGLLERAGCPVALADRTAEFFRTCAAARFAPNFSPNGADPGAAAEQLILALEAEPCLTPPS